MTHTVRVREAGIDDIPAILLLMEELAGFEGLSLTIETDEARLRRQGFGERPRFKLLLAERDGRAVGFLRYRRRYSVWSGSEFISLDDLFVSARAKGRGIGRALMRRLAETAAELGMAVQWNGEPDNEPAWPFHAIVPDDAVARWSSGSPRTFAPEA